MSLILNQFNEAVFKLDEMKKDFLFLETSVKRILYELQNDLDDFVSENFE
jgi:hypothetical protein